MRIWKDGDFEIWFVDFGSSRKTIRCCRGEQEAKVTLSETPAILRLTDSSDVAFAKECLEIVERNYGLLLEKWVELNS